MTPPQAEPRPWRAAAAWLALLGPLFFLLYGLANWFTAQRAGVPSYYFDWERSLPFVPQLMLPYMSIDLFFAASLFVCRTRAELDRHAQRIIAAILISVAGFLLFPLRFAFDRPAADGFNGLLLDLLTGFDQPFNQAPSLHISLLLLLWVIYARHLSAPWRYLMHLWFSLIGLSVLLVYQHHIIDLYTGLAVGMLCLYGLPDGPLPYPGARFTRDPRRRALGWRYLGGGLVCALAAGALQGWAWLLLWPAAALIAVASGYWLFGVAVFQKQAGRHSLAARWLLAPYLLGSWLSYRWYTAGRPASAPVAADVHIGRLPRRRELAANRWRSVIDLTAEFSSAARGRYDNLPLLDLVVPDPDSLRRAAHTIEQARGAGPVLVHCALGASRSAVAVIAWLVRQGHAADIAQAERLLAGRWRILLSAEHRVALAQALN